ncbi:MAG: methyltransferase, TIGR04325 family [Proteobacteria bacterium]|nr:methyltransferase, TIGR04325 family [Pseudomonadota bacterium]
MPIWDGVFDKFAEAGGASVFDGDVWLGKMRQRGAAVLAKAAEPGAIAPIAETSCSWLPAVAALTAPRDGTLRILDFGGGVAEAALSLFGMFSGNCELEYTIVESEGVCRLGRELLGHERRVSFRPDLPPQARFDIVHCASALHYVENWTDLMARFAATQAEYLLFADLPAADNVTFVTAQNFHGARIPVHFWNLATFVAAVEALGYRLTLKARYRTALTDGAGRPPTQHFSPPHRLDYFAQLLFRQMPAVR